MTNPRAIILEIDGVLSDDSKRRHLIDPTLDENVAFEYDDGAYDPDKSYFWPLTGKPWKSDYETYHAACMQDDSNEWCYEIVTGLPHIYLILVTSRPEKYRPETVKWLHNHDFPTDEKYIKIFMRPDQDPRSSLRLKKTPIAWQCTENWG